MSEELYFFKVNKKKAKEEFEKVILDKSESSFRTYLINDSLGIEHLKNLEERVLKDFSSLNQDDVNELFNWVTINVERLNESLSFFEQEKLIFQAMGQYGFEIFHQVSEKKIVRLLHFKMRNYANSVANDSIFSFDCTSNELSDFLNYIICSTRLLAIFLNSKRTNTNLKIESLVAGINEKTDNYYNSSVLKRIDSELGFHQELTVQLEKFDFRKELKFQVEKMVLSTNLVEKESFLTETNTLLDNAILIKSELANYTGQTMRLHIC